MKDVLNGRLALDASVLVELTFSTDVGKELLGFMLEGQVDPHTTEIAEAELRYILCRRVGKEQAEERVANLQASGYLTIDSISGLIKTASSYKSERAISLADCFCLAQAKALDCPALFSSKENELLREITKRPFEIPVKFLRD
jgi:predicted nucleic acid-binding protein